MRFQRHCATPAIALATLLITGCATTAGSRTVQPARFDYNQAVAHSWNEQLLLNLVRLRYRDTTLFIEVSSVITQYTYSGTASAAATLGLSSSTSDTTDLGLSGTYSESPTITYTPLQGKDFVRRLLAPISTEHLSYLAGTGWSLERVLLCCVDRLNGLENAASAAGPTPTVAPRYEEFQRASNLLRELQVSGQIELLTDDDGSQVLSVVPEMRDQHPAEVQELHELLRIDIGRDVYKLVWQSTTLEPDELALKNRSLLGVLYYLSQGVQPPPEHEAAGWVTVTRDATGQPFDWSRVTGSLMQVYSSKEMPRDAYVRIRYRDHWFYIADNDLNSKTTFALLTYLFSLQSTASESTAPALTVSTGGR